MSAAFIARRYFFSKGNRNAVNVLSALSMLGFACGTGALLVVLSVFNGFEGLIGSLYNRFDPTIKITAQLGKDFDLDLPILQQVINDPLVDRYGFVLEDQVVARYADRQTLVWVKGVDSTFLPARQWSEVITAGEPMLKENNQSYALVGDGVANRLQLDLRSNILLQLLAAKTGTPNLMSPEDAFSKAALFPSATFGIQQEIDGKYILVPRDFAADLLDKQNQCTSLELFLKKGTDEKDAAGHFKAILGKDFTVADRAHQHEAINKIVNSEKLASYIILCFILLIAGFNIVASLSMLAAEKSRDISILHAMGAPDKLVFRLFTIEGLFVSIGGTLLGLLLGFLLVWGQATFGWVGLGEQGSFVVDAYPVKFQWSDFILVLITGCGLGSIMAIIPAYKSVHFARWMK